jgi:hypothetical protein
MLRLASPNRGALSGSKIKRRNVAKVGPFPGVTTKIGQIEVCTDPHCFLLDTPGVMIPRISGTEQGLKLALIGSIADSVVGIDVLCQFLLNVLNFYGRHQAYMRLFKVPGMLYDWSELAEYIAVRLNIMVDRVGVDTHAMGIHFINRFRHGAFGRLSLEDPCAVSLLQHHPFYIAQKQRMQKAISAAAMYSRVETMRLKNVAKQIKYPTDKLQQITTSDSNNNGKCGELYLVKSKRAKKNTPGGITFSYKVWEDISQDTQQVIDQLGGTPIKLKEVDYVKHSINEAEIEECADGNSDNEKSVFVDVDHNHSCSISTKTLHSNNGWNATTQIPALLNATSDNTTAAMSMESKRTSTQPKGEMTVGSQSQRRSSKQCSMNPMSIQNQQLKHRMKESASLKQSAWIVGSKLYGKQNNLKQSDDKNLKTKRRARSVR